MKFFLIMLVPFILFGCYSKEPIKTGLEGKPLPSFNLLLSDSISNFNTTSIPPGQPVALLYFGPYCPYSRAQMEIILNNIDALKAIHFYVFTAYPYSDMKKFYDDYNLSKYPNITVGIDYKKFFREYFEVPGVPYMALYDKDKKLRKAFLGQVYTKQIKAAIED